MSERAWRLYVGDMLQFAQRVMTYTDGMDQDRFVASALTYDATLRNLELIGEAASKVPIDVQASMPQIPWRQIIATRNRVIHGYLGLDNDTLWSIIQTDVPALIVELEKLTL
ncbi:MAG: DUF86 domain-containing protein [Betaproteobacteria bacterium]|nr:MAG: DUF86 domain-containing protein [Betaproteobacteria bacterium]